MSTLSGIVSKGEKGKSKFQSLDINSLYRVSRGESLEQHQQKSTLPRKHGMQSLGKVPSARRPPANLPSLKSEYSNSDPAVSLVPSGGSGWATTKEPSTSPASSATNSTAGQATEPSITHNSIPTQCVAATIPSSTQSLQQESSLPVQQQNIPQSQHSPDSGNKSSWSAIMTRPGDVGGVSAGQQQQQSQQNRELNAQYGPGPSLRPQTEGSWIQGGSRTSGAPGAAGSGNGNIPVAQGPPMSSIVGAQGHAEATNVGRANLGQSQGMASAQAGQQNTNQSSTTAGSNQQNPNGQNFHPYRGLIPPFMCRGNFPQGGFPSQFPSNVSSSGPRPRFNNSTDRQSGQSRTQDQRERPAIKDDILSRPIIKEEDLTRMDEISHDAGWAAHDDIDYNQKLAFSDDEGEASNKEDRKESSSSSSVRPISPKVEKLSESNRTEDKDIPRSREITSQSSGKDNSSGPPHRPWYPKEQAGSGQRDYRHSSNGGQTLRDNYNSSNTQAQVQSQQQQQQQQQSSSSSSLRSSAFSTPGGHPLRGVEEEELWTQRRREQGEKVASAVERARQRKEEEEKRYNESAKQASERKLRDLEQKLKEKQAKQKNDEEAVPVLSDIKVSINVPAVPIPVPEWERDRDERERSRTSSEGKDEKHIPTVSRDSRLDSGEFTSSRGGFRQDISRAERERDRDQRETRDRESRGGERDRERDQPAFSRHFQSNLPPRFQKQQAERGTTPHYNSRTSPNADRIGSQTNTSFPQQYDPGRWSSHGHSNTTSGNSIKQSHSLPIIQRGLRTRADSDMSSPMDDDIRPPSRDHASQGRPRDERFRGSMSHHGIFDSRKSSGYHDDGYSRTSYKDDYGRDHDDRHSSRDVWERERNYDERRDSRDFRERDTRDKEYDTGLYNKNVNQSYRDERERSDSSEWGENRRDDRRDERSERSERPQRPDSRDSRASRESKNSLREDDSHKSTSWAHDPSDYDEKRELYRIDDHRDRDRERERDRRQPPGPITREKLQASEEAKNEKRTLIQLKRGGVIEEKKEIIKELSPTENHMKKESDVWSRKTEFRSVDNRNDNSQPKAWADAVSPTFEKDEDKLVCEPQIIKKEEKEIVELKESMEKLSVDKRDEMQLDSHNEEVKEELLKDDKREKNIRNRTNSGGSRGRDSSRGSGNRQWGGSYNVYTRGWRGPETRGRRGTGQRMMMGRPGSAKSGGSGSGSYLAHTDSEMSGDEISGSTESGKEDRGVRNAISPKPSSQKMDKDERNRENLARRDDRDKRSSGGEYGSSSHPGGGGGGGSGGGRSERNEKRTGSSNYDSRVSREGFAPSGEPSRRGRGGFRVRGATSGGRIEGYGPPPSKSPFSTEHSRGSDDKQSSTLSRESNERMENETNPSNITVSSGIESTDDKIIAKQQALTAGITGRRNKSPNMQSNNSMKSPSDLAGGLKNQGKKDDNMRSKRNRSGSRRGRDNRERPRPSSNIAKQSSSDVGNEEWETTSENSEDHTDDHKSISHSNKSFAGTNQRGHVNQGSAGIGNNISSRRNQSDHQRNNDKSKNLGAGSRVSSGQQITSEKRSNAHNPTFNQRPMTMQSGQSNLGAGSSSGQRENGRPRSQGSANASRFEKSANSKDTTINRVDEIKLNDPSLVDQALKDIGSKKLGNQGRQQEKIGKGSSDIELSLEQNSNNCQAGSSDSSDVNNADGKNSPSPVDTDGFQEVRSKKNLKDSRHGMSQKDTNVEIKPTSQRRDNKGEKDRERDRSKSKLNGPPVPVVPTTQQNQSIPPTQGQAISQAANILQKPFDRNSGRQKLAPRFQKQRLAKQQHQHEGVDASGKINSSSGAYMKECSSGPAPPPSVNAWDKPFTSQLRDQNSPNAGISADMQSMSGLTGQNDHSHGHNEVTDTMNSGVNSQRNSPSGEKSGNTSRSISSTKDVMLDKNMTSGGDTSSPPVQTLIFENTNYSKTTKTSGNVGSGGNNGGNGPSDMAIKAKFSNHLKQHPGTQQRVDKRCDIDEDQMGASGPLQHISSHSHSHQHHQQQALSVAFTNKSNELMKEKSQEPIQMPLSFNKSDDSADMKLDFNFDSDLSQLTDDKSKSLGMTRSMHMAGGHSTISPSTADLNLKIASVKKVWESAPMPTVVEHEDGSVVSATNTFPQSFETGEVDDAYIPHQQYTQNSMKNEITASANVCKLVTPQVKPQQQNSGGVGGQTGSTVPGPSSIGPGQSPIGHPPASLQGPLSPPPFNSTGQPSHINYQEFPQYPGSQAAQYGSMSAIPSPPAVLFNTGSGQLPAQAGGLYGAFQLDQNRSPFAQYPPYGPSLGNSFNPQNVYVHQPPPPHATNPPTPDMYQSNLSQYRIPTAAAPPFGQNQQLSNNPNTVLISSSSNSLMSASVKPSSQTIGAIGTKATHFQAQTAPQSNQLAYIPYDPNQVLGVSGSYMSNSGLVQRPGPSVQPSANSYYSATSADVFPGSQTGFYQGGAAQQTGTYHSLQGFGQHSQSLATGSATPVGLQNFSSQFLSGSGLQIAAAAAAGQFRNPTGGLQTPANAAATFLSKHQQEQPRQLKSPSGNQDVLASVFSSSQYPSPQISSPKSRNCKQQSQSQQSQSSSTQHHKYQHYQGANQSAALVSSYNNYVLQQNVRGMGMPRGGIQPSQQRYPPPIQRPVVPFPPGPNNPNQQQQQQNCMPNQQQNQMNRHRPNIHQQQQRNMKMQQQYYSGQGNVKMDNNDKGDSHNDKIVDGPAGNQGGGNKSSVTQQDVDSKDDVQQNE